MLSLGKMYKGRIIAQSLNPGQVLSLGKTCGSVRGPSGPRHGEGPAPNALAHLLPRISALRSCSRSLIPLMPMYLGLVAFQPQDCATRTPRLVPTRTGASKGGRGAESRLGSTLAHSAAGRSGDLWSRARCGARMCIGLCMGRSESVEQT